MAACVFVCLLETGNSGEQSKSEENNCLKGKECDSHFFCLQTPVPPLHQCFFVHVHTFSLGCNPASTQDLTFEVPAQLFFCVSHTQARTRTNPRMLKVPPQVQVSPEGKDFVCCHHNELKYPFNPARISHSLFPRSLFYTQNLLHS